MVQIPAEPSELTKSNRLEVVWEYFLRVGEVPESVFSRCCDTLVPFAGDISLVSRRHLRSLLILRVATSIILFNFLLCRVGIGFDD